MAEELKIGIGADPSGLNEGLASAGQAIDRFVEKAKDIGKIGDQLTSLGTRLSLAISLPLAALGKSAIDAYGEMQSLKMGLTAVMGTAAAANDEFTKLREVAKLPGLGLKEAVQGSVNLQAAGFSADQARRSLMAFGNALATVGKGAPELSLVNLALTQLNNKTGGFAQDLRQLTEQLPQLRGALTAAFGTVDTEAISKMGITGHEVVEKLTAEFEKLPKVTGGIKNAFENLHDNVEQALSRLGETLDKSFNLSGILDKISDFVTSATAWFSNLDPMWQTLIIGIAGAAAAAGPLIVALGAIMSFMPILMEGIGAVGAAFTLLTGPIGLVVAGIIGIVAAVTSNWGKIKPYVDGSIKWFIDLYNQSTVVRVGVQSIGFAFEGLWIVIKGTLSTIWQNLKTFGKGVLELFSGVGTVIKGVFTMDWATVTAGYNRGLAAIGNTVTGIVGNTVNGVKNTFSELNKAADSMANLKLGVKVDAGKTKDEAKKKIKEAVNAAVADDDDDDDKNPKKKKVYVEIQPVVKGKMAGLMQGTEMFDSLQQLDNFNAAFAERASHLPLIVDQTSLKWQASVEQFAEAIKDGISQIMESGIVDFATSIGEALADGGNFLAAAGGAILQTLGQFMVMLGKEMIKLAVTTIALGSLVQGIKKWIIANPGAAIALAVVAIAAGAALSAFGGNVSRGSGGSGGGGSYSSGSGGGGSYSSSYSGGAATGGGTVVFRISGNDLVGVLSRAEDRNIRNNAGR